MEIFLTVFLCSILHQFASALSVLIRRRLARLQEKGNPLFHSVSISLGIPLIWFLAVGSILLWLADQFGQSEILKLTDRIQFSWQDIDVGFFQVVVTVALFFVIKPVVAVLEGAVAKVAQRSQLWWILTVPNALLRPSLRHPQEIQGTGGGNRLSPDGSPS